MVAKKLSLLAVLSSAVLMGCGSAPEPKKMPTVSPDQQAQLDKAHAESKAQQAPADAPANK